MKHSKNNQNTTTEIPAEDIEIVGEAATTAKVRAGYARFQQYQSMVEGWLSSKYTQAALFFVAFVEAIIFPIPVDVFLIPMVLAKPKKWLRLGFIATAGSVAGSAFAYALGYFAFALLGNFILNLFDAQAAYEAVVAQLQTAGMVAVFVSGVTPIPFKVFALAAGVVQMPLWQFIVASFIGRGMRFFGEAALIRFFGSAKMNVGQKIAAAVVIVALSVGGWLLLKHQTNVNTPVDGVEAVSIG